MHLSDFDPESSQKDARHLSLADKWILSRLNGVVEAVTRSLDEYKFNEAAGALYQFVWHEFCDWYLEIIKPVLYSRHPVAGSSGDGSKQGFEPASYKTTRFVVWSVLSETLRLLHPFIPFVTEEIWHKLPGDEGSIMKAEFPLSTKVRHDAEAEATMDLLMGITTGIRNIRGEMNVPPSLRVEAIVQSPDGQVRQAVKEHRDIIVNLAKVDTLKITAPGERPASCAMSVFGNCTIFVSLKDIIDFKVEQARLNKEIAKISKELQGVGKKLGNEDFLNKAPQDVVEGVRAKRQRLCEKKNKLQDQLSTVSQLPSSQ
jgi:valyl-tRNA synthetase